MAQQNKEQHIITIAREVFLEYGYEKASLQMIMERGDVSKWWVYHYFSSKDEIFEAVIKGEFSILLDGVENIVYDASLGYQEKILRIMAKKRSFYTVRYELLSAVFSSEHHIMSQYRAKSIISPLFEPYITQLLHESQGRLSIETIRILFWLHEMLFESALPYVQTVSEFEKYMDALDGVVNSLLK